MDFYEQIVKQKKDRRDFAVILGTIAGGLLFAWVMSFVILPVFFLLWIFIPCWFGYFIISGRCLEYEYSLSDETVAVYRLAAKRRRRKMLDIDLKNLQGRGTVGDERYRHFVRKGLQVLDFGSRSAEKQNPFFVVPRPKGTYLVIIEPDETMAALIEKHCTFFE